MPRLLIQSRTRTMRIPLSESVLVGRHASCTVTVEDSRIPAFWLEIRWTGTAWAWRPLAAVNHTRGPGAVTGEGWRVWRAQHSPRHGARISLGDVVSLSLVDPGPPVPVVELLGAGTRLELDAPQLNDAIRALEDGAVLVQDDGTPRVLSDGEAFVLGGEPARIWIPDTWQSTDGPGVVATADDAVLDVYPHQATGPTCVLTQRSGEVVLRGEEARLVCVYAMARKADGGREPHGFRLGNDAFHAWVTLGGNAESRPERLAWLRSRIKATLAARRVSGVDALFQRRRVGRSYAFRLALEPKHIHVHDGDVER